MSNEIRTPDVIIAGVTKAGSTSLFTYLADHPDICGSSIKEISHFVTVRFGEPARPLEQYNKYYGHYGNERFRLESSPAYFLGGRELAKAIRETLPNVKIVLVLREPVSRFRSHFNFNKSMLRLPKEMSLGEYFEKCQAVPYESFRKRNSYVWYGLASGIYANYLSDWTDTFSGDLYIAFFDDLINNPKEFTEELCRWIGVSPEFYQGYDFVVENKSRSINNPRLQKMALKFNKTFEGFLRKNIAIKRALRGTYYALNGSRKDFAGQKSRCGPYAINSRLLRTT